MSSNKKKILVLGAGFGGVEFCKKFRSPGCEITLIDRQNHHLFQPLLYQVATTGMADNTIAISIRSLFKKREDIKVLKGEVTQIDLEGSKVVLDTTHTLDYDYLVIATGAKTSYFGRDAQWAPFAPGMKSVDDAHNLRNTILSSFEKAELETDPAEKEKLLTIALVGGGPTGLELAGALSEYVNQVAPRDYKNFKPSDVKIILIEAMARLIPPFTEQNSERAKKQLEEMGVDVRLNHMVKNITDGKLEFEDGSIEAANIFWTAGVGPGKWTSKLGVETDRAGRIVVEQDCSLKGHSNVFAIGDVAAMTDIKGVRVPGVAPAAIQMADYSAEVIQREIVAGSESRETAKGFAYWDKGATAIIGKGKAVLQTGSKKLQFGGFFAWFAWLLIHLMFLAGWRAKISSVITWMYSYGLNKRSNRLITQQDATFSHAWEE
ncbi:MAG: NAD(P)/FAD-dependent oxidoreductase [Verrucomicrobiota bacterium]